MKVKTLKELEKLDVEKAWRVDVVLFNEYDGEFGSDNWEYWCDEANGVYVHPSECYFTKYGEALGHIAKFTDKDAEWALSHGNGTSFTGCSIEISEMHDDGGWYPDRTVATRTLIHGKVEEWKEEDMAKQTKKRFTVEFSTTLSTTMTIEAETEEEAYEKANELRYDEAFAERVIAGFEGDYEGYRAKYWSIEVEGEE